MPLQRVAPVGDDPDVGALVEEILGSLRVLVESGRARAVAWCVDMRVTPPGTTEKTDALVLFFESRGVSTVLVSTYRDAPGAGTTFATPYSYASQSQIFV